jgi:hypothetical protein
MLRVTFQWDGKTETKTYDCGERIRNFKLNGIRPDSARIWSDGKSEIESSELMKFTHDVTICINPKYRNRVKVIF